MNSGDDFGFRLTAVVATAIGAFGLLTREARVLPDAAPPRFATGAAGPRAEVRSAAERAREARAAAVDAAFAALRPPWARGIVVHPAAGPDVPGADLPEGPPYHVVVGPKGGWSKTSRLTRGLRAAPPGAGASADALHVLVLDAASEDPERDAVVRDLWAAAVRAFGSAGAARYAFEAPDATLEPPPRFDPARWVAPPGAAASRGAAR